MKRTTHGVDQEKLQLVMLGMAEKGLQLHSSRQQQQKQQQQHTCSRHLNGLETRITSPPTTSPCNKKGDEVSQSSGMMMATLPPGCGRSPSAAPSPRACPCKGKSPPKTSKKGQQQHRQVKTPLWVNAFSSTTSPETILKESCSRKAPSVFFPVCSFPHQKLIRAFLSPVL